MKPCSRGAGLVPGRVGLEVHAREQIMSKILVVAAAAAVALGSLVASSDANARYVRAPRNFHGYDGYVPEYYGPRRFYESLMYAPDAPAPRNYNNPGIPDFQDGSRG
jgi:hypothetical protein